MNALVFILEDMNVDIVVFLCVSAALMVVWWAVRVLFDKSRTL